MAPETKARLRPKTSHLAPAARIKGFDQVEKMWTQADAMKEGSRCLRCDLEEA